MKIQDDKSIKQVLNPEPHKVSSTKSDTFKNILSEVQSKIEGAQEKKPLHIDRLEKPTPHLQSAGALADPKKNLRELSPLVKLLEREQNTLEELGKDLADGDKLQDILNQAVILSQVEVSRFNRGDYL